MSTSPATSSVEQQSEKHQQHPGPFHNQQDSIIPDGVTKTVSKLVEDGRYDVDSSIDVQISERQLSWQRAAVLLFTEYIVLAILAMPYTLQVLGMAGGILTIVLVGLSTAYTSHVLWRFLMAHPQCRDICDVAYVFTGGRWGWYAAFIGLALNNLFIMGLHCVAGATAINTLNNRGVCSAVWGVILLVIMWAGSLIRDLRHTTILGIVSAGTMFICFLIVVIGHGVQGTPNGYVEATAEAPATNLSWTVWAPEGTTFVQAVNAVLNVIYTYIGHALIPSFIGDMKRPEDFPKALYLSITAEIILFSLCGAIVYSHTGTILTTAPAYGSLIAKYSRPAAAMVLPTIIIVGVLYSIVTSRAVFFQIFPENSIHRRTHTFKGWSVWVTIVTVGWIIAYIIGESIPFFSDMLSLICSLFDSFFGYIFWAFAFKELYRGKYFETKWRAVETVFNVIVLIVGLFLLGPGSYASIQSIINSYAAGAIKSPFTCVDTGFTFTR